MLGAGCPGASNLWGTPTLAIKKCPECGAEVEIFSSDVKVKCRNCGFVVFNDIQSCIEWCKYAEKCLGGPLYKQLKTAAEDRKRKEAAKKEEEKKEGGSKEDERKEEREREDEKKAPGINDAQRGAEGMKHPKDADGPKKPKRARASSRKRQ